MTVHGSAIVNVGMCAVGLGTKVNIVICQRWYVSSSTARGYGPKMKSIFWSI